MKEYIIELERTEYHYAKIIVQAENTTIAEDCALEEVSDGDYELVNASEMITSITEVEDERQTS